jgi:polysaccharide export outer membrane protein
MFNRRSVCIVFALISGAVSLSAEAQDGQGVPKELVQYVRDAQKAGLKAPQIRQNAVKAGWGEAMVDNAISSAGANSKSPTVAEKPAPVDIQKDATPEPSPAPVAATPPASPAVAPPAETTMPKTPAPEPAAGTPPEMPAGNPSSVQPKPADKPTRDDDYQIGEGDVLQIAVYGEPTASVAAATVRPDGKISVPLVKDVQVAGLTPAKVEASLQEQLSKVIRAPDVTVIVSQINSKKIFLTGAVKREGPLKYTYRMTVLQAISEAGGLTDYAKRKKIYVLHTEAGQQFRTPFDYTAVLKGLHMEQNIVLAPGDTIVVP